jgi:hypothetical protein
VRAYSCAWRLSAEIGDHPLETARVAALLGPDRADLLQSLAVQDL